MTVHAIDHFNIRAPHEELLVLRDFYCAVVGLTLGARPPFQSRGFWLYADGAPILHLSTAAETESLPPVSDRRSAADHIAFRSSNIQATLKNLRNHGVSYSINTVPLTKQVQVFFEDPSGFGVELNFDSTTEQLPVESDSPI
jgi:catechol 2,3-dioxygenase-like lactoylglutathione lyase family enzyme